MEDPKVSVIVPAYNDAGTLKRTVKSCLLEKACPIEVVVVDDASTDETLSVAMDMAKRDSRVRVIHHEKNLQALEARRSGMAACKGSFVLFLDADDWLDPEVCSASRAVQQETNADIVAFSIVPEYPIRKPSPEVVLGRSEMYTTPDILAEGPDIVHATFRDDRVSWSLCGKLFAKTLLERAFAHIPRQRMFQCEDAYLYFVIASLAARLVGRANLPVYRYSMGTGDTRADATGLTSDEFDSICKNSLAAKQVATFLDESHLWETYREDYAALRFRLLADPTSRYPHEIAAQDRSAAFDDLVTRWPSSEAIGWLAARHWNEPGEVLEAADGAASLARSTRTAHSIAVYFPAPETAEDRRTIRALLTLWESMSLDVVLILDEGHSAANLLLPGALTCETIPSHVEAIGARYITRAQALQDILTSHEIDVLVYCGWQNLTLPWDLLVTKTLGASFVICASGPFTTIFEHDTMAFFGLPRAYFFANGVVCRSAVDQAFWSNFNSRSYLIPEPQLRYRCSGDAEHNHRTEFAHDDYRRFWKHILSPDSPELDTQSDAKATRRMWSALLTLLGSKSLLLNQTTARIDELEREVALAKSESEQLRAKTLQVEDALEKLSSSVSFKIGRTLTGPLRQLRDLLNGKH